VLQFTPEGWLSDAAKAVRLAKGADEAITAASDAEKLVTAANDADKTITAASDADQAISDSGDTVYRALHSGENPESGLFPKNPDNPQSVLTHVRNASNPKYPGDQFISTTKDPNVAIVKYAKWSIRQ
jgi:hypothetical protein